MTTAKIILGVLIAVLIALLTGWLMGASSGRTAERALQAATLQSDLLDARSSVLSARVDLYNVNFGNASRHLEEAKGRLRAAEGQLKELSRQEDVTRVGLALSRIDEAQQMAGKLDQGANARAADAVSAIDQVLRRDRTP